MPLFDTFHDLVRGFRFLFYCRYVESYSLSFYLFYIFHLVLYHSPFCSFYSFQIHVYLPWLEDFPNYVLWLPDYFAGVSMMLFCSALVFNPKRLEVFRWYVQVMTIVLFMRATTIVSTLVPTPIQPCIGPELPRVPGLSQDASFWLPSGSMFCNDQMFSGHTTVNTISIWFFLLSNTKSHWGWRMFGLCHLFLALVATLATHDHYMMDILVGFYISSAVVFGFRREIQEAAATVSFDIAND